MAARIVLFGATGYTGRLAAEAMVERGLRPVLAARAAVEARRAGRGAGRRARDARPPTCPIRRACAALVEQGDVLVTTVGPFAPLGRPGRGGGHHEPGRTTSTRPASRPSSARCSSATGRRPSRRGIGMLTAFGYDWVPGNLAGALALDRAGELATRVDVGYFITGSGGSIERRHAGIPRRARSPRPPSASATAASRPSAARSGCAASRSARRSCQASRSAAPSTSRCRGWRRGCAR